MPSALRKMLEQPSVDETDRMPDNIHVSRLDVAMYVWAIIGHFVDLGVDLNIAIQYYMANMFVEFGWTLTFILLPAFINTAISVRMYAMDKKPSQDNSVSNTFNKVKILRLLILFFQMAPILRFIDALIYAVKARAAAARRDPAAQRRYYKLMLQEEADAALLRVVECFLEAAPQQLLQLLLLYRHRDLFKVHQLLSITSSIISMGWCLAAYQRAIRFAQEDKRNMSWMGSILHILWHFTITLSRIVALSAVSFIHAEFTLSAIFCHIVIMAIWVYALERPPFCSHNCTGQVAFSIVMGMIYIFTYIMPIEGPTRYRYTVYYTICFLENVACAVMWFLLCKGHYLYHAVLIFSLVPFLVGIVLMVLYYGCFHPKIKKDVGDSFKISFKKDGKEECSVES